MSWVITREHEIHAGHRVVGHTGCCQHMHGHEYHFTFIVGPKKDKLDSLGMVTDFAVIRSLLCSWLDKYWDHKFLLWIKDPWYGPLTALDPDGIEVVPVNPTVENLAEYFVEEIAPGLLLDLPIRLVGLRLQETSKCAAVYTVKGYNAADAIGVGRGVVAAAQ